MSPAPLPRHAVVALSMAAFGAGVSMRVSDPLLPLMSRVFATGLGRVALVISLFSIAYGTALLLIGPLGEKHGKYRVVTVGTALCALTALACGLASGFEGLLAARIAAGLTAAAIIPLSMAWIGDVIDYEHRQSTLARFLIGQILGSSAGASVGGMAAEHGLWRAPFFGIALWFAASATLLWQQGLQLPERAKLHQPSLALHPVSIAREIVNVLRLRWARVVLLTVALEGGLLYGGLAFVPTHLHERLGLSLGTAGALVMLFGFGGFAFAVLSRRLVARLGEPGLVRHGARTMCAGLVLAGFTPWAAGAALACFAMGIGFYMLHNTLQVHATQMAPQRRSVAVSLFAAAFFLGQALGVQTVGLAMTDGDSRWVLAVCGVALLVLGWRVEAALAHAPAPPATGATPTPSPTAPTAPTSTSPPPP